VQRSGTLHLAGFSLVMIYPCMHSVAEKKPHTTVYIELHDLGLYPFGDIRSITWHGGDLNERAVNCHVAH
jgi:hypothetical protein